MTTHAYYYILNYVEVKGVKLNDRAIDIHYITSIIKQCLTYPFRYGIVIIMRVNKERETMEYISDSYGMFSEEGDKRVASIIMSAIEGNCTWNWVMNKLDHLGGEFGSEFEEATDTYVREAVWERLSPVYEEALVKSRYK